ncbi:MAG: LysE family translocator [Tatlockia sp.]|nr:LysE family translocator [Tatlockia sp.]
MDVQIIPFLVATFLTNITPGAALVYNIDTTIRRGRWCGFLAATGVEIGTFSYALMMAFGLSELITASPLLYHSLKLAGEVYLIYLAYKLWPRNKQKVAVQRKRLDKNPLMGGFILNIMNPQLLFFFLTLLPQFVSEDHHSQYVFFMLGAIFTLCSFVVNTSFVLLSHKFYSMIKDNQSQFKWMNYLSSLSFLLIAVYGVYNR